MWLLLSHPVALAPPPRVPSVPPSAPQRTRPAGTLPRCWELLSPLRPWSRRPTTACAQDPLKSYEFLKNWSKAVAGCLMFSWESLSYVLATPPFVYRTCPGIPELSGEQGLGSGWDTLLQTTKQRKLERHGSYFLWCHMICVTRITMSSDPTYHLCVEGLQAEQRTGTKEGGEHALFSGGTRRWCVSPSLMGAHWGPSLGSCEALYYPACC